MPVASPPGDPGGTFIFPRRPSFRLPRRYLLHIALGLLLWATFLSTVPPFRRSSVVGSLAGLFLLSFGSPLAASLSAALFLAGRRRANPGLMSVSQLLSGLDDGECRRWEAEGFRRPRLRAFVRNVIAGGTFLLHSLAVLVGSSAALGFLTYGILRVFVFRRP